MSGWPLERKIEGVDTVVIACGGRENNALYYALKDRVKEIHLVGDAMGIRMNTPRHHRWSHSRQGVMSYHLK